MLNQELQFYDLPLHCCIFSKLCRYAHHIMGVCCVVFDIDGMLFNFFIWLNGRWFLQIVDRDSGNLYPI